MSPISIAITEPRLIVKGSDTSRIRYMVMDFLLKDYPLPGPAPEFRFRWPGTLGH